MREHVGVALHDDNVLKLLLVQQVRRARVHDLVPPRAPAERAAEVALLDVHDGERAQLHHGLAAEVDDGHAVVLALRQDVAALAEEDKLLVLRALAVLADAVPAGEVVLGHLEDGLVADAAVWVCLVVHDNVLAAFGWRGDGG